MIVTTSARRGLSYQLTSNLDTLRLTAGMGDTAMGYIKISDGRDPSSKPMKASIRVSGYDNFQILGPQTIYFSGSITLPVIYSPTGSTNQALLTVTTDSGKVSVYLGGTLQTDVGLEMNKPFNIPFFDSLKINRTACQNIQISNRMNEGIADSITITGIWVEPWHQSSVGFTITNAPVLPHKVSFVGDLNFSVCALALDPNDSNLLLGFLHITFTSKSGDESALWPVYGFVIYPDTMCIAVDNQQINCGSVFEGDTVIRLVRLHNRTTTLVTIDSAKFIDGDMDRFTYLSPSFPFTIDPNSVDTLEVRFTVPAQALASSYSSNLEFWPRGTSRENLPCGTYIAPANGQPLVRQCLTYNSPKLEPIPEGSSQIGFDTIFNNSDSVVFIDSMKITGGDLTDFSFQPPTLPAQIPAHSDMLLGYRFTVPTPCLRTNLSTQLTIWDRGTRPDGLGCNTLLVGASGSLLIPWDTILLQLPPSSDSMKIDVHAAISDHVVVIQNATAGKIYLVNAQLVDTGRIASLLGYSGPRCVDGFRGSNFFCFDDSLGVGAWSDSLRFRMEVSDSGVYPVSLLVNFANALQAQNYTLLIHYVWPANAAVRIPASSGVANFSLKPNPATGQVTIWLPSDVQSTVEIYDLLGTELLRKVVSGPFIWNGETSAGEVPTGSYIVRVSEADDTGGFITSSKRLMFIR
ncbi:MAG: T9SS type A sorting domain-containing protein [Bacteroidota bacterium]|nr:T9SS type A sorting domain-containing protein [Bacteroidota bacterium]